MCGSLFEFVVTRFVRSSGCNLSENILSGGSRPWVKGEARFFCRLPCRLFFLLRFVFFYPKHSKHGGGGGRTGPTPRSASVFPWHLDRSESTCGNYVGQRDATLSHKMEEERPEVSQSKMTPNPWISRSIQKEATRTVCVLLKLNTIN